MNHSILIIYVILSYLPEKTNLPEKTVALEMRVPEKERKISKAYGV
jgi:hypothetical protein